MIKIILVSIILLTQPLFGFYFGAGLSWNTIDETFNSNLHTSENKSGKDRYDASRNRFAPVIQVGYDFSFCTDWNVGFLAQWKYLNYKTPNENSSRGQILQNASFSSKNIFGDDTVRDFTSKTRLNNEFMFLGYLGKQFILGNFYLGVGPAIITASNSIYVSSVHTPNGVGDHLISTSVKKDKTLVGGAIQAGYQYCLSDNFFINVSYTYLQTSKYHFKNTVNAAELNGFETPGSTTLFVSRSIKFTTQQFIFSINYEF